MVRGKCGSAGGGLYLVHSASAPRESSREFVRDRLDIVVAHVEVFARRHGDAFLGAWSRETTAVQCGAPPGAVSSLGF